MYATRITQIDRYTFRQVFVATLVVTGGVVALIWLIQSLRFVELVVNRGLSLGVFLRLTGLLIPGFVAVILPITCFVVVQFVYQRLAGDRELTVMRGRRPVAAGPGPRRRCCVTAMAVGAGYALNIWLVPVSPTAFRRIPVRNPQPHGRLPAAGGRLHPDYRRSDGLYPFARAGRHVAGHTGR